MPFLKILGAGLMLGLTLSPACLGACFPLLIPYFASEKRPFASNVQALLYFLGGRFAGYAVLGAVAGWIGGTPVNLFQRQTVGALGSVCVGSLLLLYGLLKSFPGLSFCVKWAAWGNGGKTLLGLGLFSGLSLCPPFLAALYQAGQSGSALAGFALLASFFVGTSLILVPMLLAGRAAAYEPLRFAGRLASMFIGAWFVFQGAARLVISP